MADDTAGAVPSSGEVVKGLRVLLDSYDRDGTLAYLIYWWFIPWEDSQRWRLEVRDSASGVVLARRGDIRWKRQARRIRARFVEATDALAPDAFEQVDWQWLLDSIPFSKNG